LSLTVNRTNQVTGRPETLFFEELLFPSSVTKIADDIYICLSTDTQGRKSSSRKDEESSEESSDSKESKEVYHLVVSSRRHYVDHVNSFLDRIKKEYDQDTKTSYIKIYDGRQEENDCILRNPEFFSSYKTFDNLFFKDKPQMLRLLQQFKNENGPREQFHKKFGCPNNLSFMLYGPPGTGKTSCIKAIANYLRRDVIMIKMNTFKTNSAFADIFTERTSETNPRKKIFVFEEIDCCFQNPEDNPFLSRKDNITGASSVKKDSEKSATDEILMELVKDKKGSKSKLSAESLQDDKLNHEGILNALDGPRERNGRVCIFTTNYLDRIDEAYLRYGRINMVVHLDRLLKEDVQRYFHLWFDKQIPAKIYSKMNDRTFTQAELGQLFDENQDRHDKIYEAFVSKKA
jgi:chaperone BCS1